VIERHAYVAGTNSRQGKDGRVYKLCDICDDRANTAPHRGFRQKPLTIRERGARHPFQVSLSTVITNARGRRTPACVVCGQLQRATEHKVNGVEAVEAVLNDMVIDRVGPVPQPRVQKIAPPPAELTMAALAIDVLLALPPEALEWSLRIRLDDVRKRLKVPPFPTLNPDAIVDDVPPTEADIARHPRLIRSPAPVAIGSAIARGIPDKRRRELIKRAVGDGWDAARTANNHIALDKGSTRIIVPTTEGYGRGWNNLKAQAKRAGIDVAGL
jgi:hypothetical protein